MNDQTWLIEELTLPGPDHSDRVGTQETLFSLANGHLGFRGDLDLGSPAYQRGTYVNGFFEKAPITYGEQAFGYAQDHQTMLNLPDGREVRLAIDGNLLDLGDCALSGYRRALDLKTGRLDLELRATTPEGVDFELRSTRFVSAADADAAVVELEIQFPSGAHRLVVESRWNLASRNISAGDDPRVGAKMEGGWSAQARTVTLEAGSVAVTSLLVTANSGLALSAGRWSTWTSSPSFETTTVDEGDTLVAVFAGTLSAGQPGRLTNVFSFSRPVPVASGPGEHRGRVGRLGELARRGVASLRRDHEAAWAAYWARADVELVGDTALQQAVRFNLFQMFQSAGRDGATNLSAKGLSGEGYEGHYFWDTEIYALPLFTYLKPDVARALLEYRHATLPQARARARELSLPGALYPWRTIDGTEASAYYPAGTAQYHINADILHAAKRYTHVHQDDGFLFGPILEMLVETARFWRALGDYVDRSDGLTVADLNAGRRTPAAGLRSVFCINTVTGPDEYTALVNNNVYTNLMASENLLWAADVAQRCQTARPDLWAEWQNRLSVTDDEGASWEAAALAMFVPYDQQRRLFPQDDSFFQKAVWRFNEPPVARRPLLLHYHPLTIYRYQVLKQPDLVLAQFLVGSLFSDEEKRSHFDYYEPLTTSDSSLSYCIQAIMAIEAGHLEKGWDYFIKTVRMDLDDLHGNARDGLHVAAMAGSWMTLVYGLGGLRERYQEGALRASFRPRLPSALGGLTFRLDLGRGVVQVAITPSQVEYRLVDGETASFDHGPTPVVLTRKTPSKMVSLATGGQE